jgi:hypothetical protein
MGIVGTIDIFNPSGSTPSWHGRVAYSPANSSITQVVGEISGYLNHAAAQMTGWALTTSNNAAGNVNLHSGVMKVYGIIVLQPPRQYFSILVSLGDSSKRATAEL